jgi:hypothetical protein
MFPIRNPKSEIEDAASGVDPASRASKARWDAGPSHRKSSRPPKNRTLLACFRGTRGATPSRGLIPHAEREAYCETQRGRVFRGTPGLGMCRSKQEFHGCGGSPLRGLRRLTEAVAGRDQ